MSDRIIPLDDNGRPIDLGGFRSRATLTTDASNETKVEPLFRVSGSIIVEKLYGVVTTALGSNQTAAYWRLNDQTAQSNISLNTGTTMSSAAVGAVLTRSGLAGAALTKLDSDQGRVSDPTTLQTKNFTPFMVVAKNGANTDIEYVYSTTSTPTSGKISFFCVWQPVSQAASVTPQATD